MRMDTKDIIADALLQRLRREPLENITVTELIRDCRFSRNVFYYHFRDLLDVVEWACRRTAQSLAEQTLQAADLREALRGFIDLFADNAVITRRLLESPRCLAVERILYEAMEDCLCRIVPERAGRDPVQTALYIHLLAGGFLGVLLTNGTSPGLDRDDLAARLEALLREA